MVASASKLPDFVLEAKYLVMRLRRRGYSGQLVNDQEEMMSMALFALGRLYVTWDDKLSSWKTFRMNFAYLQFTNEMERCGYPLINGRIATRKGRKPKSRLPLTKTRSEEWHAMHEEQMAELGARRYKDQCLGGIMNTDLLEWLMRDLTFEERYTLVEHFLKGTYLKKIGDAFDHCEAWAWLTEKVALAKMQRKVQKYRRVTGLVASEG